MNVMDDQFVRRDGWETSKLVVGNNIMSSFKGSGRIFLDTLVNFTLPFGASGWRSEGRHLEGGVGEDGVPKRDKGVGVSSFPSSSLRFFDLGVSWDKGSFFKFFTWTYLSLLYLVAISTKQKVRKPSSYKEKGNKRRKVQVIHILLFQSNLF